jgi:hypothetical protein
MKSNIDLHSLANTLNDYNIPSGKYTAIVLITNITIITGWNVSYSTIIQYKL